jgi:eukaryotic-like serine/threonine-protein kinase
MADPQPPETTQPGPGPFERWYRVTTSFVGREAELATLAADLDATADGRGGVVLVAGGPGIGKTRLAEELAAQATTRGALVLWGRCREGEGAPAFWPWIQIVRGYVETAPGHGRRRGRRRPVVPAVRERLPELPAPPPVEPEAARFRLFDSVAGFLRAAAARRQGRPGGAVLGPDRRAGRQRRPGRRPGRDPRIYHRGNQME